MPNNIQSVNNMTHSQSCSVLVFWYYKNTKKYWKGQLIISILDKNDQNSRPESIEPMVDTKQQKVEKEMHLDSTDNISGKSG